jgi:aryl-alcohol dehydrogenase-like predicted oxidoreductase
MKLGLGTVQFGLQYGIANSAPPPSDAEVKAILAAAQSAGIEVLDTAPSYGTSEEVLGRTVDPSAGFRVVSKVGPFKGNVPGVAELDALLKKTFERLRVSSLYGLLIHAVEDLEGTSGSSLAKWLLTQRERGLVQRVGVSCYYEEEAERCFAEHDWNLVQLPLNIFDQRFPRSGLIQRLRERGVEVHARSLFLQGLLLMPSESLPPFFGRIAPLLREFERETAAAGVSKAAACLDYAQRVAAPHVGLCGVASREQLLELTAAFQQSTQLDFAKYSVGDPNFLIPMFWKK